MWIPENIIIRNVEEFNPGAHGENIPEWLDNRIDYVLKLYLEKKMQVPTNTNLELEVKFGTDVNSDMKKKYKI